MAEGVDEAMAMTPEPYALLLVPSHPYMLQSMPLNPTPYSLHSMPPELYASHSAPPEPYNLAYPLKPISYHVCPIQAYPLPCVPQQAYPVCPMQAYPLPCVPHAGLPATLRAPCRPTLRAPSRPTLLCAPDRPTLLCPMQAYPVCPMQVGCKVGQGEYGVWGGHNGGFSGGCVGEGRRQGCLLLPNYVMAQGQGKAKRPIKCSALLIPA